MRRNEYGPNGFWWDRMWQAGNPVSPGFVPEEPLIAEGPLPASRDTEVQAMILCMRHRCRASECGCTIGEGT